MPEYRMHDDREGEKPTDQRWGELLEQLVEQIIDSDIKLRDEDWISAHQVTDFERMMLMEAFWKLMRFNRVAADRGTRPPEQHGLLARAIRDEESLRGLGLSSDQVADEIEQRERRRAMLTKMAAALMSGRDPFDEAWLTEHGIVEPERSELYQAVGVVLYGYEASHNFVRAAIHKAARLYVDSPDPDSWLQRERIAKAALDDLRNVLKPTSNVRKG